MASAANPDRAQAARAPFWKEPWIELPGLAFVGANRIQIGAFGVPNRWHNMPAGAGEFALHDTCQLSELMTHDFKPFDLGPCFAGMSLASSASTSATISSIDQRSFGNVGSGWRGVPAKRGPASGHREAVDYLRPPCKSRSLFVLPSFLSVLALHFALGHFLGDRRDSKAPSIRANYRRKNYN